MAAAVGGFDEEAQQLREEIQVQLDQCHGLPDPEVYQVQDDLRKEGNMLDRHHVSIGPRQWNRSPEEEVLNREHEKLASLNQLLREEGYNNNNNGLLLELIKGVNEELGTSNHGCEGLQRKELVKRMLLDGCYIVYKFAKCRPIEVANNNPSPRLQGNHDGLLHMMLRHITNCIMDITRGVHNAPRESAAAGGAASSSSSSSDSDIDLEDAVEMRPVGEPAQAAGAADERRRQPHTALAQPVVRTSLARWLECRDTWCLMNNCVPYGVLDVINHLAYRAPEGGFGGATARILLQCWSMYYYVPPSPNPVHIVPRATVQQAGDANCLLILLAQLLIPLRRDSSSLLNSSTCHQQQQQQEGAEQLLCRWRRATDYVRCCNARFVASPLDAMERLSVVDVTATVRGCFRSIDVQVPRLLVDGTTLALLRNLVELEQRDITPHRYVTAYCFFMSKIASQAEDVELLEREGIIEHPYNDPMDVARGFMEVVQVAHVSDVQDYLLPIAQELRRRSKSTVHRRLSWLRVSCWTWADILALITLLLGVLGVVYAALSYYKQAAAAAAGAPHPSPSGRH